MKAFASFFLLFATVTVSAQSERYDVSVPNVIFPFVYDMEEVPGGYLFAGTDANHKVWIAKTAGNYFFNWGKSITLPGQNVAFNDFAISFTPIDADNYLLDAKSRSNDTVYITLLAVNQMNGNINWSRTLSYSEAHYDDQSQVQRYPNGDFLIEIAVNKGTAHTRIAPDGTIVESMILRDVVTPAGDFRSIFSLICSDGGRLVLQRSYDNAVVMRFDASHNLLWGKKIIHDSLGFNPNTAIEYGDGSFYITGNMTTPGIYYDVLAASVLRLAADGELITFQTYIEADAGGSFPNVFNSRGIVQLIPMANGTYLFSDTEETIGTIDFESGVIHYSELTTQGHDFCLIHKLNESYALTGLTASWFENWETTKIVRFENMEELGCLNQVTRTESLSLLDPANITMEPATVLVEAYDPLVSFTPSYESLGLVFTEECHSFLGTEELQSGNFSVFPNPVNAYEKITIETQTGEESYTVVISDVNGQVVYTNLASGGSCEISVQNFGAGMYFVTLETSQGKSTHKLVVE